MNRIKIFIPIIVFCLLISSCASDDDILTSTSENSSSYTEESNSVADVEPDVLTTVDTTTQEDLTNKPVINPMSSDRCFYGLNTGTSLTATGLEPLDKIDYKLADTENSKGYSTEMQSHGYGVATNEKAHQVSVTNQQIFDEQGYDAVCLDTVTEEKVIYLTFDCGYENGYTAKILDVLQEKNVPAAFFCTLPQMRDNHEIIARMINEGHIVGNHSVTHPDFSTLSRSEIADEIKGFDDYIRENFGYSSLYFRFPQGKYSENSMRAVNELGYKCVFWSLAYADWDLEAQQGAQYAHDTVMSRIHPGAVILLHAVSPDNANALADIIDSARAKGYEFRSLEDM